MMKHTPCQPKFGWVGSKEPSPELLVDMQDSARLLNVTLVNKRLSVDEDINAESEFRGAFLVDANWLTKELISHAQGIGFSFVKVNSYRV